MRSADVLLPQTQNLTAAGHILQELKHERAGDNVDHLHPVPALENRSRIHPDHVAVEGQRAFQIFNGQTDVR